MLERTSSVKRRGVIVRPESFGGIIYVQQPPAQLFVDRRFMARLGCEGGAKPYHPGALLSAPCEVHFSITNVCPLSCPHCYANGGRAGEDELPLSDVLRAIDVMANAGVFQIAFGGGEPFAHPDLENIVRHTRRRGITPNITTNGYFIDERAARFARAFGQINVSVDGVFGPAARLRDDRAFDIADQALRRLVSAGANTGINMVVSAANFDHIADVARYARSIGVRSILLLRYKPAGRGEREYAALRLTAGHLRRLVPLTWTLSRRHRIKFRADCSLFPAVAYHSRSPQQIAYRGMSGCDAGNSLVSVTPAGAVKACSFCPDHGTHVLELARSWPADAHLRRYRDWTRRPPEPCDRCCWLDLCKGGCHPIAELETGDFHAPDPACPIVEDYMEGAGHAALTKESECQRA